MQLLACAGDNGKLHLLKSRPFAKGKVREDFHPRGEKLRFTMAWIINVHLECKIKNGEKRGVFLFAWDGSFCIECYGLNASVSVRGC